MVRDLLAELAHRNKNYKQENNPFADDVEMEPTNPFAQEETNPFAQEKQYKEENNPFAVFDDGDGGNDTQPTNEPKAALLLNVNDEDDGRLDFSKEDKDFQNLKDQIEELDDQTHKIRRKIKKYESTAAPKAVEDIHAQLEQDIKAAETTTRNIGKNIKALQEKIFESSPEGSSDEPTLVQWKKNQFHLCTQNYEVALSDLHGELQHYQTVKKGRITRLAKQLEIPLTEDQLEQFSEEPKKMYEMVQSQMLVSTEVLERLTHLEDTRDTMLKIEAGIRELLALWNDFNLMLEMQQDQITSIEQNLVQAHRRVKKGVTDLKTAGKHQESARRMQCMLFICCLVILVAALGGGLGGSG